MIMDDFKLKVFLCLDKYGSFTMVATQLKISQAAVSQNIMALERQTGIKLFVRAKGEAYLTPEGQVFKQYAEKILYWYKATELMFGPQGKIFHERPIRIAADGICASFVLPPVLSLIEPSHKELSFVIEPLPASGENDVFGISEASPFGREDAPDVVLTADPLPETMDFEREATLVGIMDAVVVCSKENHSIAFAASAQHHPFSTLSGVNVASRFALWSGYKGLLTPDILARTAVETYSVESIKALAKSSADIAGILPCLAVKDELARGDLLLMPVPLPAFALDIHFRPLPEFAGKTICHLLRETLTQVLRGEASPKNKDA